MNGPKRALRHRLAAVLAGTAVFAVALPAPGSGATDERIEASRFSPPAPSLKSLARTEPETLWIFDADFEDLLGDNAGWTTSDRSGTLGKVNYWHKDTIRINGFEHLGDSTWWCGTYNDCWRQPRGYGNNWECSLSRDFPEVAENSSPGDTLVLEFDQRYALEHDYDYAHIEISTDDGSTWTTEVMFTNPGFARDAGTSQDWDSTYPTYGGHMVVDLSRCAGQTFALRFRVTSDQAYSSQDQYNNPPRNTCLDGAWQLDNIAWLVNGDTVWLDDCESPGDNGWVRDDIPATGQTGVTFWRGELGVDFEAGAFSCDAGIGWMYAAVDAATGRIVDEQYAWLMSPPIDIGEATELVGQWEMWIDLPAASNDYFNLYLAGAGQAHCVGVESRYVDEQPGWWNGGPYWVRTADDWTAFAGRNWLGVMWAIKNDEPMEPGAEHGTGIFLSRQRVGIPTGGPVDSWEFHHACGSRFRDWFVDELTEALEDSARVVVIDADDIVSVTLLASSDGGATWQSYPCDTYQSIQPSWMAPPPDGQMTEGAEVLYYFEAVDGLGQTGTFPDGAPDECFEFSILPRTASTEFPGILLVDKHHARVPGEDRSWLHSSLDYYREALDVLGYVYDVYEVESPGTTCDEADGPDISGMKYYDTVIWAVGNEESNTLSTTDQLNLIDWLGEGAEGGERNLLIAGDNVGREVVGEDGDALGFYADWLAAEYLGDAVGEVTEDSLPTLRDADSAFDFMTYDDRRCRLRGGCPRLSYFDVVGPDPARPTAERVAEYVRSDMAVLPAGVACTDTLTGYQAVTLGFGLESMVGVLLPTGDYLSGAQDRADLMSNIMDYFGRAPTGPGTGVSEDTVHAARLGYARPNPFNPRTTIEYGVAKDGPVVVRIFDLSGRLVRTLVDADLAAGDYRAEWYGRDDEGREAASGVYFVRIEAKGFADGRKIVLLK